MSIQVIRQANVVVVKPITNNITINNVGHNIAISRDITKLVTSSTKSKILKLVTAGPQGPAGSSEDEVPYGKQIDFVGDNIIYKGEAIPGSGTATSVWRINRTTILSDGDVIVEWANGTASFDKVWDNRVSYNYT